jgi:hypothetical protein
MQKGEDFSLAQGEIHIPIICSVYESMTTDKGFFVLKTPIKSGDWGTTARKTR